MVILWTLAAFVAGAIPFSVWIGRQVTGEDIRAYGDHNPGATNVLRAGGFLPFSLALFLDISKGAFPVGLATIIFGIHDWQIVPIAVAPVLGHAFSPFLGWRGGKAIAVTFGVWIGLTLWTVPLLGLVLLTFWTLLLKPSGWAVLLTLIGIFIFLLLFLPEPLFLIILSLQSIILIGKHGQDLRQKPELRFLGKRERG